VLSAVRAVGQSVLGMSGNLWHALAMSTLTVDLQATIKELDSDSATKLERLVRDAMALARPVRRGTAGGAVDKNGWPVGHFEKYAGCLAGEEWEPPADPPPEQTPE